jgi:hypothetical protein
MDAVSKPYQQKVEAGTAVAAQLVMEAAQVVMEASQRQRTRRAAVAVVVGHQ